MNDSYFSPLTLSGIQENLPNDFPWKNSITVYDTIGSTNTQAKLLGEQGAPHGTVLIADAQTGGRGRRGRSFHSPAGVGVYMSVLIRPNCKPEQLMHLTCAAAVAMCNAVESVAGFRPGIKWTNDLVFGHRKLAGILTELGIDPHTGLVSYAVIGTGINCGQKAEDFPADIQDMAGSLSMVAGKRIPREKLASAMIQQLESMGRHLLSNKNAFMESYCRDCITLGKEISLVRGDEVRHGKALSVDNEGALIVRFPDGHLEAVNSGEVSVRGMYGYV